MQTIIDVRTPDEFKDGNVLGSINIPLQLIHLKVNEVREMQRPIVLCCASGNRSEQAKQFLKNQGIECSNGGSWISLNQN
jgi:phage shock protein E